MRFTIADPVIADDEGFTPAKDIFGHADFGRGLASLIARIEDPMVIAIDGPWGTGKSIFLRMWASHLRSKGFPVVLFDAFANDYIEDAFSAISAEIVQLAASRTTKTSAVLEDVVSKSMGVGKVILRSGLKLGVKAATFGIVGADDISEITKDVAKELSDLEDTYLGEIITKKRERDESLDAFRDMLTNLPGKLQDSSDAPKPLVVIIDELDRCNPKFALELLERVKHIFSVPNVHFALGVNLKQLQASISAAYGSDINSAGYLNKFIHAVYSLSRHSRHERDTQMFKFIHYLKEAYKIKSEDSQAWEYATDYLRTIADRRDLTLREIQRAASAVVLALAFSEEKQLRPTQIIVGLAVMKAIDPGLFAKARQGRANLEEVSALLGFQTSTDRSYDENAWWIYTLASEVPDELNQQFRQVNFRYNVSRERIIPMIAEYIVDGLPKDGA